MKLAIEITETGLRVGLYQQRLKGWACQQRAELPWRLDASQTSMAEQLVATLRPSLLAWGVKPDTSVIVAPSGDVGGVLSMTELDGELTDERIEKLIAQHEIFLQNLLYPQKGLQSRDLCFLPFLARWGSGGLDELQAHASVKRPGRHYLVPIP